jgi:F420-dependent oxidoreductase-like protein
MEIGIIVPQGWTGEYQGWDPGRAWDRSIEIGREAERLGFESLWAFDHMHTTPDPTDTITFESFMLLASLVGETQRVRLGHLVACAGYRNPALLAKMIGTLDIASGGRMELGIGAGWKQEEWEAYGYRFPSRSHRLAALGDSLEVVTAMLAEGRATFAGEHASVRGAINEPRGLQRPRVPIIVGGNGRTVTWRLAARYADELNLDAMPPGDLEAALPVIAARCHEVGRDPATLRISVHIWWEHLPPDTDAAADLLASYAALGVSRVQTLPRAATNDDEALARLSEARSLAGLTVARTA